MLKKSPNPIDIHVGSRIRMRRTIVGISQEKLGEALGVTFQQVQKYEKGTNRVGASRLQRMAEVLNVQIGFFFEGNLAGDLPISDSQKDPVSAFVTTREGIALITAFSAIEDRHVRQTIISLARSLSASKTAAPDADAPHTAE